MAVILRPEYADSVAAFRAISKEILIVATAKEMRTDCKAPIEMQFDKNQRRLRRPSSSTPGDVRFAHTASEIREGEATIEMRHPLFLEIRRALAQGARRPTRRPF